MGKLSITVDAEAGGKKLNFVFTWKGDEEEIQNVVGLIEKMADDAGLDPAAIAQATLLRLASTGVMKDELQRKVQMMAIIYVVLHAAAEHAAGPILKCAATQDITAKLTVRGDRVSADIKGHPTTRRALKSKR